jgi:hypothetical protein
VKAVLAELEKTPKAVLDHQANAGKQKDNKAKEDKAKHSGGSAKVGLASTYVVELILVRSETPARRDRQGQYSLLGPRQLVNTCMHLDSTTASRADRRASLYCSEQQRTADSYEDD